MPGRSSHARHTGRSFTSRQPAAGPRGARRPAGRCLRCGLAAAFATMLGSEPAPAAPPLTAIAEVRALPPEELDRRLPVDLAGTVTFRFHDPDRGEVTFVIQDDDQGLWVQIPCPGPCPDLAGVSIGDRVAVSGLTDRGAYSPLVLASSIEVTGSGPPPPPEAPDVGRLFRGDDNGLRVALEGIVQGVRAEGAGWIVVVDVAARRLIVRLPEAGHRLDADAVVDAVVRITGVTSSLRNTRGEFVAPALVVNTPADIEVLEPPPSSPFAAPLVPLERIARFRARPLAGHRFQTEGVITRAVPGRSLYLQSGQTGVRVETAATDAFAPGDIVRVAGFLDMSRQVAGITDAVVRRVAAGPPPPPVAVTAAEILAANAAAHGAGRVATPADYAGCLVRLAGTLVESRPTPDGGVLVLGDAAAGTAASMPRPVYEQLAAIPPGSLLAVTGIVQLEPAKEYEAQFDWLLPPVERIGLIVFAADDVVVVRPASWWTPRRLAIAAATLAAVLAAALAWAWSLRREVAVQARAIAREMRSRREAAVEFQATLRERNRLAANLHDTLLQTLAGIGFQLEACQMADRLPPDAAGEPADHLDVARRMVDHAVAELRGSVWALRSTDVHGQSLAEAIDGLVAQIGAGHPERISARTTGVVSELPSFVTGNLLLIVQEAIHNALRHARAATIEVVVAFDRPGDSVEVSIRDDGSGFEPGGEPGPADGHFGLQGMRERAERLGGDLTIETAPAQGTLVRATVRRRDYDPELAGDGRAGGALADPPMAAG